MVRCPRDFRAICTAVAPDAVGTLRIYNPTPPVYDGHLVPCSSDHNRAIMPNCELQPRELLKNVPTRVLLRQSIIEDPAQQKWLRKIHDRRDRDEHDDDSNGQPVRFEQLRNATQADRMFGQLIFGLRIKPSWPALWARTAGLRARRDTWC